MTTEGKARDMGHQSTEIRGERKNKSISYSGDLFRVRTPTEPKEDRRPSGPPLPFIRLPTLQNEMRTRINPNCASFACAPSCATLLRTCPVPAVLLWDNDQGGYASANGTRLFWVRIPG